MIRASVGLTNLTPAYSKYEYTLTPVQNLSDTMYLHVVVVLH